VFLQTRGPEHCAVARKDMRITMEWLFPETTKNFDRLPLQYRVLFCVLLAVVFFFEIHKGSELNIEYVYSF